MTAPRRALVLRPAPGAAQTVARLAALGVSATALPLFAVSPCRWTPPAAPFDALLLTSANAVRHAGPALAALAHLPVVAVGPATAAAARAAGLDVAIVGDRDVAAAVRAAGARRLLHLAGRDHVAAPGVTSITVYASDPVALPVAALDAAVDNVVLLHSRRAAERFAALSHALPRDRIRIAALSPAVAAGVGVGWRRLAAPDHPVDAALVATAARLAIDP